MKWSRHSLLQDKDAIIAPVLLRQGARRILRTYNSPSSERHQDTQCTRLEAAVEATGFMQEKLILEDKMEGACP